MAEEAAKHAGRDAKTPDKAVMRFVRASVDKGISPIIEPNEEGYAHWAASVSSLEIRGSRNAAVVTSDGRCALRVVACGLT